MKIKLFWTFLFAAFLSAGSGNSAFAETRPRIVATTSTFASIVKEITGDWAQVDYIASPQQNIHFIVPNPKDVLRVKKADVFVHGGLDLEAWRDPLLDATGRRDFISGGSRSIDVSKGVPLLEVPGSLSRAQGDIHAFGNPHYWTDPENAKVIADNIASALSGMYPDQAQFFLSRAGDFKKRIDAKIQEWTQILSAYKGEPVVVYHESWPYFLERFGIEELGTLEPKPGIPPTPKHLQEIVEKMRSRNAKVIIREVFHEKRTADKVARETGARVVTLEQEAGQSGGDYIAFIEKNVSALAAAFQGKN